MSDVCCDTKAKIMQAANQLFYRYGFEGASIRKIAQEAGVNVAAINYHFKNKENLFIELFIDNYRFTEEAVYKFYEEYPTDTKKFVLNLFNFIVAHGPQLVTCFKFLIEDNISKEDCIERCQDMPEGPPGFSTLINVIRNELNTNIDEILLKSAAKSLSGFIIHNAIMLHSGLIKARIQATDTLSEESITNAMIFQVEATLHYLKVLAGISKS